MDFTLSDDRRMLSETLNRFLDAEYDFATRNTVAYAAPFHAPKAWATLAELGIIGALTTVEKGGFGGTGADIAVVFEALGRKICPEPFLPAVMAMRCLDDVAEIVDGTRHVALATGEIDAFDDSSMIATTARAKGDFHRITGRKSVIYGGHSADQFLVSARHGDLIGLFEVDAKDADVTAYGMVDGGGAADIFLDDTPARLIKSDAVAVLENAVHAGTLALCAEAVGAMEALLDMTLEYLKTRQQFGRPIGDFQALQHRFVDVTIEVEQARSITIRAAADLDTDAARRSLAMAKHLVGRVGRMVAEEAIQMHGGIAMTWEHPAAHFAKRLVMIDHQLGDEDLHLERFIELST